MSRNINGVNQLQNLQIQSIENSKTSLSWQFLGKKEFLSILSIFVFFILVKISERSGLIKEGGFRYNRPEQLLVAEEQTVYSTSTQERN